MEYRWCVITYATKSFPVIFETSPQFRERYFCAVATSKKNEDSITIFSGWKVFTDSIGMPVSRTTSYKENGENLFSRARRINESDSKEVVFDVTFSLPDSRASNCKFILKQNDREIMRLDNLASISNSKNGIKSALDDTTGIFPKLLIKRWERGFFLYRFYGYINTASGDNISASLIDTAGLVMDTLKSPVGISEDAGQMNIISTIYALSAMPTGTADPLNPASIPTLSDSAKLKLLITAMVDLSLAHNSPQPDENEQKQGIFTNYMQFMDNVVGMWDSVNTGAEGITRLRKIHNIILELNKNEIADPVIISNLGTCFERDSIRNPKRMNYVFYEGYARVNCKFGRPEYSGKKSGIGVLFRTSNNIELYGAEFKNDIITFDSNPFLIDSLGRRIIYRVNNTIMEKISNDSGGVWIKANTKTSAEKFYIGIEPVRLPVSGINRYIKIDTAFSLSEEKRGNSDPEGKVIGNAEKSILKMEALLKKNDTTECIRNTEEAQYFLHGQRRKIVFDINYNESGSRVVFKVLGSGGNENKILMEEITDSSVVLHDTSLIRFGNVCIMAQAVVNGLPNKVFIKKMGSHRLILKDAVDGELILNTYIPKKYKGNFLNDIERVPVMVERDPDAWLPSEILSKGKVKIRWDNGDTIYDMFSSIMLPTEQNSFKRSKLRSRSLSFDDWYAFKDHFLDARNINVSTDKIGETKISFSCKTGLTSASEVLEETIRLKGYRVIFTEHENQNFGFDKVASDDNDYISVDGNYGETKVYVHIKLFNPERDTFWATSSDSTIISINGGSAKMITSEKDSLVIKVEEFRDATDSCLIFIRVNSIHGKTLKNLHIMIYKKKLVDYLFYARVVDPTSAETNIIDIVNKDTILNQINQCYKQAIINVDTVNGKYTDTCTAVYDLNKNGALDFYENGDNSEYTLVCDSLNLRYGSVTNCPRVAQFEKIFWSYHVDSTVKVLNKGTMEIKLERVGNVDYTKYILSKGSGNDTIRVVKFNTSTSTVTLREPLRKDYDNSDGKLQLHYGIAGLSTYPWVIVTGRNNNCSFITAHELLHLRRFADLADVNESDNLMYYRTNPGSKNRLRYRQQTKHYEQGTGNLYQWNSVDRSRLQ